MTEEMQNDNATMGDAQTPGEVTPQAKPQEGNDAEYIERSAYVGLQRLTQKLTDEKKALEDKLGGTERKVSELEVQLATSTQARDGLTDKVTQMTSQIADHEQQVQQQSAEIARWNLVRDEFPDLVSVAHLVPLGSTEEMTKGLRDIGSAVAAMAEGRAQAQMAGVVPRAGGSAQQKPTLTDEQLWELIDANAGTAEGRKYSDMWEERTRGNPPVTF